MMAAPYGRMPWDIIGNPSRGQVRTSRKAKGKRRARLAPRREPGAEQSVPLFSAGPSSVSFGEELIESKPIYGAMKTVSAGRGTDESPERLRRVKRKRSVYVFVIESQVRPGYFRVEFGHDPAARLRQHNRGAVLTTAHLGPWKIRHQLRFSSERRAKRFVRYLKVSEEKAKRKSVARSSRRNVGSKR